MQDVTSLVLKVESSGVGTASQRLDIFVHQAGRAERATDRVSSSFKKMVAGALAVYGTVKSLNAVVSVSTDLESALSGVEAVTGATAEQMAILEDKTRDLGATTKFTATQAAEGMRFLGMAGFDVNQTLSAMPGVLNLAAAGQMELAQSADIASNILSGFRLEAEQTNRVVDVLAHTASNSNTSVVQLGEGMSFVAPISSSLGISLEATAAAMGVLSDNAIQGERAGTGLRAVIAGLTDITPNAEKELKRLGLSVDEVNPKMNDLDVVLKRLQQSGFDANSAFQIFGRVGAPAVLALVSSADKVSRFADEIENSGGAASEMARILSDNLQGALRQLDSATDEFFLTLNDTYNLLDNVRGLVDGTTETFRVFSELLKDDSLGDEVEGLAISAEDVRNTFVALGATFNRVWKTIDVALKTGETAILAYYEQVAHGADWAISGAANLFENLFNGIVSGINASVREVYQLADSLPQWAKDLLGIDSAGAAPSIDFRIDIDTSGISDAAMALSQARQDAQNELQQAFDDLATADEDYLNRVNKAIEKINRVSVEQLNQTLNQLGVQSDLLLDQKLEGEMLALEQRFADRKEQLIEAQNNEREILRLGHDQQMIGDAAFQEATLKSNEVFQKKIVLLEKAKIEAIADLKREAAQMPAILSGEDPTDPATENMALDALRDHLTTERDIYSGHFGERKARLLERANDEQEILRSAFENREIQELEYQALSKEHWERYNKDIAEITRQQALATQRQQLQNYQTLLGMASDITSQLQGMAKEGTDAQKALFVVQKGISIAQAIINTELAATRALAEGGAIFGIPMSTAIRALGYTSVGLMVGQTIGQVSTGNYAQGGVIPGSNYNGDNLTAKVNSGEMILDFAKQQRLLDIADGKQSVNPGSKVQIQIHNYSGEKTETRRTQTNNGEMIEVIIGETQRRISSDIRIGGGPVSRAIEDTYPAVRRGT